MVAPVEGVYHVAAISWYKRHECISEVCQGCYMRPRTHLEFASVFFWSSTVLRYRAQCEGQLYAVMLRRPLSLASSQRFCTVMRLTRASAMARVSVGSTRIPLFLHAHATQTNS